MSFTAKAIANYFLDLAKADGKPITPMQIQKLVYYAHGWWLGLTSKPLIDEQVECWKYGPVIQSLFHEFKAYGSSPISEPAYSTNYVESGAGRSGFFEAEYEIPVIPDDSDDVKLFLARMWKALKGYSATKLSNMSHVHGGPWHRTVQDHDGHPPRGTDIPTEYIREYFKRLAEASRGNL